MESQRRAVGLVADPLQELEPGIVPLEHDRLGAARDVHLLLPLRERHDGDARQVVGRMDRIERRGQLTTATVDDHEVRSRSEARVPGCRGGGPGAREPARHHLRQRSEVVLAFLTAHGEGAVVSLLGSRVLEHRH